MTKAIVTKSVASLIEVASIVAQSQITANLSSIIRDNRNAISHRAFDYLSGFTFSGIDAIARDLVALSATGKYDPRRIRKVEVTAVIGVKPTTLVEWQEDSDPIITDMSATTFRINFTADVAIASDGDDKYFLDVDTYDVKFPESNNEVLDRIYDEICEEFMELHSAQQPKPFARQNLIASNTIL